MTVYVPVSHMGDDYRPSQTGNDTYSAVTIRGIFDSMEKAKAAIEDWACVANCDIETFYIYSEDENGKEILYSDFDIDYDRGFLYILCGDGWNRYSLNKIVDEDCSAVYNEESALDVTDW